MAQRRRPTSRQRDLEEDEGRQRYSSRSQSPNMAPVVGIIAVVAIAGVGFAVYSAQNKKPVDAGAGGGGNTVETVDPFASVPDEEGPKGLSPGGKRTGLVSRSPEDLLDDPVWTKAAATANEWIDKHNEAQKALRAKDNDTYLALGPQVRDAFNKLLEDTAEWEMGLSSTYSENDMRVRKIMRERDKWFQIVGKYKGLKHD